MFRKRIVFICLLAVAMMANTTSSDVGKFQSIFIYTFAKYIEWPTSKQQGDFVIGVFGDSPAFQHLEKMAANKTKGNQRIAVKKLKSAKEVGACHILFIGRNKSALLGAIKATAPKNMLIVSDKPDMVGKGSDLNFVMKGDKLRFEMSNELLSHPELKVSTELSKFAIMI